MGEWKGKRDAPQLTLGRESAPLVLHNLAKWALLKNGSMIKLKCNLLVSTERFLNKKFIRRCEWHHLAF